MVKLLIYINYTLIKKPIYCAQQNNQTPYIDKMLFNSLPPTVVFQELPNEISLCFSITGCNIGCKGCHSTELWDETFGIELSDSAFSAYLTQYHGLISAVVFFGGEWQQQALVNKLKIAQQQGLKTCLYTGLEQVSSQLMQHLDFLKTGKWQAQLGGLDNPNSNQTFINVNTGEQLNYLFRKTGNINVTS